MLKGQRQSGQKFIPTIAITGKSENGGKKMEMDIFDLMSQDPKLKKMLNDFPLTKEEIVEIDGILAKGFMLRYSDKLPVDIEPKEFIELRDFYGKVWEKTKKPKRFRIKDIVFLRAIMAAAVDSLSFKREGTDENGLNYEAKYLPKENAWSAIELGFHLGMAYNELKFNKPKKKPPKKGD